MDGYEPAEARRARFDRAEEIAKRLHEAHRSNAPRHNMVGRFGEWDMVVEADKAITIESIAELIQDGVIK